MYMYSSTTKHKFQIDKYCMENKILNGEVVIPLPAPRSLATHKPNDYAGDSLEHECDLSIEKDSHIQSSHGMW